MLTREEAEEFAEVYKNVKRYFELNKINKIKSLHGLRDHRQEVVNHYVEDKLNELIESFNKLIDLVEHKNVD